MFASLNVCRNKSGTAVYVEASDSATALALLEDVNNVLTGTLAATPAADGDAAPADAETVTIGPLADPANAAGATT